MVNVSQETLILLRRLAEAHYKGGYGGTCYQCPFASEPLRYDGTLADYDEYSNDPTEAFFKCNLPGRNGKIEWGEYAPCTGVEWFDGVMAVATLVPRGAQ